MKRLAASWLHLQIRANGLRLAGDARHWQLLDEIQRGAFEPETVRLVRELIRPGAVVVDVGACLGFYTLLAAQLAGPGGVVYAFEPDPRNVRWLHHNLRINHCQNVTVVPSAVSDAPGVRQLFLHQSDPSQSSLHTTARRARRIPVQTVTLDGVLDGRRVDLIKLDIEGGELRALKGLRQTITSNPQMRLLVELNPRALGCAQVSESALVSWLEAAGFSMVRLDERCTPEGEPIAWNLYCEREELAASTPLARFLAGPSC